jgi:hypothetical protein
MRPPQPEELTTYFTDDTDKALADWNAALIREIREIRGQSFFLVHAPLPHSLKRRRTGAVPLRPPAAEARDTANLGVCATTHNDRHYADFGTFPERQQTYGRFFSVIFLRC